MFQSHFVNFCEVAVVYRLQKVSGKSGWKVDYLRKARRSRLLSRGVIFTRASVSLALLSLRTGGLLVVYLESKWHTTFRVVSVENFR